MAQRFGVLLALVGWGVVALIFLGLPFNPPRTDSVGGFLVDLTAALLFVLVGATMGMAGWRLYSRAAR